MVGPARRRMLALGLLWGLLPLKVWADFPGTIARVKQSVVAVGTYVPVGNPRFRFLGTGFVVGGGNRVVTNAHVLASVPEGSDEKLVLVLRRRRGIRVPATGQALRLDRQLAGTVVDAFYSPALAGIVGTALLTRDVAHPGLSLRCEPQNGEVLQLRTVAPPLLNNRSAFVHPLQHSYAERAHIEYPALSRLQ